MSKGQKVWFKWQNGDIQRVYIYKQFHIDGEPCYRGKMGNRSFVFKQSDYGKTWSYEKEELGEKLG